MTKTKLLPTIIAMIIGAAGVALLLFAWHLPPFHPSNPTTENAYIQGKVTSISPQLSGYVSAVEASDFQQIAKGDVIARIDDRIYRQKLAQAEAQLAAARAALQAGRQNVTSAEAVMRASEAALSSARAAQANAQSEWDRANQLQGRGVASQASADQARQALDQANAAVTQAEAQLDVQSEAIGTAKVALSSRDADIASAEAQVELARIDLENTVIRAQDDGRLGALSVRVGQYVSPGTALVSEVGSELWIIANFRETELAGIDEGDPVRFTVDAVPGRTFDGVVESFSPATASEFSLLAGSNATGNFTKIAQRLPVRIGIDPGQQDAAQLAPGLSVVVHVQG
ncbi:HlyD family secretion protein [Paracoccus sp. 1_MG-2023]|uniref:HlyD family secretion protein n=1 Tax=unclassified Paracoccus (in: a-proteobacteria) TaxID=2688777 RepID=UPI001C08B546|nr:MULTISPECIES: HlyD family secretion protein [unclassified Paracoccus (in: a-proteobacteria)]MBU2956651.1 HlyD family secretion protein [Paracoccus sp. C2R09]MDO6668757.1 HlyD family secretion protein [Paracoccus sp. 1_MG-2023]